MRPGCGPNSGFDSAPRWRLDRRAVIERVGGRSYHVGVNTSHLAFERRIELAPLIVWDALVDPDLVEGWLGEATIDAAVGGRYIIDWLPRTGRAPTEGVITELVARSRLAIETVDLGRILFELEPFAGGDRGTGTIVRVSMSPPVEPAFVARVRADWLTNLDQLGDLLRGHPVDWSNWERDRAKTWSRHLDDSAHFGA